MSYSLNYLKGLIQAIILGTTTGVMKGDTKSLDYGSYCPQRPLAPESCRGGGRNLDSAGHRSRFLEEGRFVGV